MLKKKIAAKEYLPEYPDIPLRQSEKDKSI